MKEGVTVRMGFLQAFKTVAWSFLGIRSRDGLKQDMGTVHPLHLLIAAFLSVLFFIGVLLFVVNWVTKS